MDKLTMWAAIVGFLMPPAIALITQTQWAKPLKGLVAFALCLIAAAVTVWLSAEWDGGDYVKTAMIVFAAAVGTYHVWWKPSGIAPSIEAATSTR